MGNVQSNFRWRLGVFVAGALGLLASASVIMTGGAFGLGYGGVLLAVAFPILILFVKRLRRARFGLKPKRLRSARFAARSSGRRRQHRRITHARRMTATRHLRSRVALIKARRAIRSSGENELSR